MALVYTGRKAVKYWNGSSWNGSADFGSVKMWNGSSWVQVGVQVVQDITATFSPDGSTSSGSPTYLSDYQLWPSAASVTITCSTSAVWNYSYINNAPSASIASGGSATSITFTMYGTASVYYSTTITLSGTAGGITKYWQIDLATEGVGA